MIDEPGMLEDFSHLGTWWHPQEPDQKVTGTLSFSSDDGIKLTLHAPIESGSFDHPFSKRVHLGEGIPGSTFGPPVIFGIHDNGRLCTLFGAQRLSEHIGGGPARRADYRGTALLMGKHVESAEAPLFDTIHFRLTYLEEWLGERPFSSEFLGPELPREGFRLTYKYPDVFKVEMPSHGLTVSTRPELRQSQSNSECSVTYQHRNSLTLKSQIPWSLENCYVLLSDLRVLFTMLTDTPLYFTDVIADGDPIKLNEDESTPDHLTTYFPQPFRRMRKNVHSTDMLFRFGDLQDRLGAVLTAWLDRAVTLRSVYGLMESVFFGAQMTPQVGLLTLTQAFEVFHRTQIGGDYMERAKYEAVRSTLAQAIPADVGNDHREALKNRIKFGNSFSMRKRIDLALKSLGDAAADEITRSRADFGKAVADTRNYLTHRDESSRGLVIKEADLGFASEKFRYFFTALLMQTLGIPAEETVAAIRRNYQKNWVLDWDGL